MRDGTLMADFTGRISAAASGDTRRRFLGPWLSTESDSDSDSDPDTPLCSSSSLGCCSTDESAPESDAEPPSFSSTTSSTGGFLAFAFLAGAADGMAARLLLFFFFVDVISDIRGSRYKANGKMNKVSANFCFKASSETLAKIQLDVFGCHFSVHSHPT
jgi:hypothetical protein